MSNLNLSTVIKVNSPCVLLNAICFHFWEKREVKVTFEKYEQRIKEYISLGINPDINIFDSILLFKSYIYKAKKDCSFIYKDQKDRSISPKISSFKDFCIENELPFKKMKDMQNFINNNF